MPTGSVVSPDGTTLYVVGPGLYGANSTEVAIVAYGTDTGDVLWSHALRSPPGGRVSSSGIAASPDGSRVYVVGFGLITSYPGPGGVVIPDGDIASGFAVALDAETGEQLWGTNLAELGQYTSQAIDVVVSPDGRHIYVNGSIVYPEQILWANDLRDTAETTAAVFAVDTASGSVVWQSTYTDHNPTWYTYRGLSISADGSRVYQLIILEFPSQHTAGFSVVARDTSSGAQLWHSDYFYVPANEVYQKAPMNFQLSPDGTRVFVGSYRNYSPRADNMSRMKFNVAAFSTADGAQLWVQEYDWSNVTGCATGSNFAGPGALRVSPGGGMVYFAGRVPAGPYCNTENNKYTQGTLGLVAFDTTTGKPVWSTLYPHGTDYPCQFGNCQIQVKPGPRGGDRGAEVLAVMEYDHIDWSRFALTSVDTRTVAYDATTGRLLWEAEYTPVIPEKIPPEPVINPLTSSLSPDGTRLYIGAQRSDTQTQDNSAIQILAYSTCKIHGPCS